MTVMAIPMLARQEPGSTVAPERDDPLARRGEASGTDVRAVLDRAVLTGPHTEARITIVCEVATADVDPTILQQIVVHLLHLEDELPEDTHIWVTAIGADDGLVVTVEDDADAAGPHRPRSGGAGATATLRLARVLQLARRHGGEMWIEPAADGGLCYVVALPGLAPA